MTKEQEEAIEILKEFKDKGYANLYIKYNGNRPKINLKIKNSIETILFMLEEKEKELQTLKEFKEIADSKVTELNPIRISKSKSIDK